MVRFLLGISPKDAAATTVFSKSAGLIAAKVGAARACMERKTTSQRLDQTDEVVAGKIERKMGLECIHHQAGKPVCARQTNPNQRLAVNVPTVPVPHPSIRLNDGYRISPVHWAAAARGMARGDTAALLNRGGGWSPTLWQPQ